MQISNSYWHETKHEDQDMSENSHISCWLIGYYFYVDLLLLCWSLVKYCQEVRYVLLPWNSTSSLASLINQIAMPPRRRLSSITCGKDQVIYQGNCLVIKLQNYLLRWSLYHLLLFFWSLLSSHMDRINSWLEKRIGLTHWVKGIFL